MKDTFNVFSGGRKIYDVKSTPIWLGRVMPIPVGAVLASAFVRSGVLYPAGCPMQVYSGVMRPIVTMKVSAYEAGANYDTITVKCGCPGFVPTTSETIGKVALNSAETAFTVASGIAIVSASEGSDGSLAILIAHQSSAAYVVGDIVSVNSISDGAKADVIGYLYNDIKFGEVEADTSATGAIVVSHAEGILIDRTPADVIKSAMAAVVPLVVQVSE